MVPVIKGNGFFYRQLLARPLNNYLHLHNEGKQEYPD